MSTNTHIPLVDLVTLHQELEEELMSVFKAVLNTARFVGGPMVESFEREFAEFCRAPYCVGVGSGTDALRFALIAAGVRPGDTVVTVPNTFIATTEAISQAGARPDFVDVDERTYAMNPQQLRSYLETKCTRDLQTDRVVTKRTGSPVTAVVPVHLYGQMADMDPILDLASQYNLVVIEDACQAHGAEYFSKKEKRWRKAGSMGNAAAFSFYPGKNLGAFGEAGALTTNDETLAHKVRMLRDTASPGSIITTSRAITAASTPFTRGFYALNSNIWRAGTNSAAKAPNVTTSSSRLWPAASQSPISLTGPTRSIISMSFVHRTGLTCRNT